MKNFLHIAQNEKFINSFINFINSNLNEKEHKFLILPGVSEKIIKISSQKNVKKVESNFRSLIYLIGDLYKAKKIFLHGLFSSKVVLLLFLQPWLLKKCDWIIWGGDLYHYKSRKHNFKWNFIEILRRFVIKRFGGIITHIKGDYELAKAWYGVKGEYRYSFIYPSNLYKEFDISKEIKEKKKVYIQIGNSADPTNNHLEVINSLKVFKDKDIEVFCPLSYGDISYRDKIIKEGEKAFGDKFKPLTELIPFEEYLNILAKIDIAIFNHKRQQAMGNITTLLGLGKKVYIRDDITTWDFCKEHGLKVYKINDFNEMDFFKDISQSVMKNNIKNVKLNFSEEKLKADWINITNYMHI